jgi:transcriptional regulator with XRE-family HTH domain
METSRPGWRVSNPAELGRALARLRRSRGLTQEQMAAETGVHRSYLARMEAGLSTEQVQRIFALLRESGYELAIVPREA